MSIFTDPHKRPQLMVLIAVVISCVGLLLGYPEILWVWAMWPTALLLTVLWVLIARDHAIMSAELHAHKCEKKQREKDAPETS